MLCQKKFLSTLYVDTNSENLDYNWQYRKKFASYNDIRNVHRCNIIVIMRRTKKENNGYRSRFNASLPNFALTETSIASITVRPFKSYPLLTKSKA